MDDLQKTGKKQTLLISISIILVSLHSIYFYNSVFAEVESKKIVQQITRFILTAALLFFAYKGKNWARITLTILFSFGILMALIGFLTIQTDIINKIPFIVMIIVYSVGLYHFGFSKNYKAFAAYQKDEE